MNIAEFRNRQNFAIYLAAIGSRRGIGFIRPFSQSIG